MLSLAEEASPLGTAAGAIFTVSMRGGATVGRWKGFWRRSSRSVFWCARKMLRAVADAFNRVAEIYCWMMRVLTDWDEEDAASADNWAMFRAPEKLTHRRQNFSRAGKARGRIAVVQEEDCDLHW